MLSQTRLIRQVDIGRSRSIEYLAVVLPMDNAGELAGVVLELVGEVSLQMLLGFEKVALEDHLNDVRIIRKHWEENLL